MGNTTAGTMLIQPQSMCTNVSRSTPDISTIPDDALVLGAAGATAGQGKKAIASSKPAVTSPVRIGWRAGGGKLGGEAPTRSKKESAKGNNCWRPQQWEQQQDRAAGENHHLPKKNTETPAAILPATYGGMAAEVEAAAQTLGSFEVVRQERRPKGQDATGEVWWETWPAGSAAQQEAATTLPGSVMPPPAKERQEQNRQQRQEKFGYFVCTPPVRLRQHLGCLCPAGGGGNSGSQQLQQQPEKRSSKTGKTGREDAAGADGEDTSCGGSDHGGGESTASPFSSATLHLSRTGTPETALSGASMQRSRSISSPGIYERRLGRSISCETEDLTPRNRSKPRAKLSASAGTIQFGKGILARLRSEKQKMEKVAAAAPSKAAAAAKRGSAAKEPSAADKLNEAEGARARLARRGIKIF